ncbi:Signal transduction histidine kinase [Alkalibacterium subtropicum]|uniref:histidine kinase n=1 Tax=Alkalibacterium subtropicum TaxID=753702 RepID=A0A1I1HPP2_9LACT|nr:HAMP domain-containing sensor histidine kinase [Alkalibacterium subtropicum]SFC25542.1 Signal transduction histidine kinase [Alkalibacterium subtropicum]
MIPKRLTKMKLPYFFQQFLGFLAVIILLMTVTVFSLVLFGRRTALNATENRLFTYAESVVNEDLDPTQLDTIRRVLIAQEVSFFVFDDDGAIVYPDLPRNFRANIDDEQLNQLESGERIALKTHHEDLLGNPRETTLVYLPYFSENTEEFAGFITVSAPISHINRQMEELKGNLFSAFLISAVVAILMSLVFAHYQVKRVNRLRKAAHKVAEGEYTIQLEHNERDEIDYLTRDFNRMVIALKESQDEVIKQEERRKSFMQDAAHEMRTPLTTINGLLEGLEHNVIPESQRLRSIKLMRKETRRLIRLVNENMDYENIRSNRIILTKHSIPLSEIVEEISEQMKDIVKESSNELIIGEMDDIHVYADYDRLKQILVNLIKNALQFTKNGTIQIASQYTSEGTEITVSDTGIGMTDAQMENIFERYYKADLSRTKTKFGESGLGLAIVQQLVHLHGAKITVESEVDKGTTFKIVFPEKIS